MLGGYVEYDQKVQEAEICGWSTETLGKRWWKILIQLTQEK